MKGWFQRPAQGPWALRDRPDLRTAGQPPVPRVTQPPCLSPPRTYIHTPTHMHVHVYKKYPHKHSHIHLVLEINKFMLCAY